MNRLVYGSFMSAEIFPVFDSDNICHLCCNNTFGFTSVLPCGHNVHTACCIRTNIGKSSPFCPYCREPYATGVYKLDALSIKRGETTMDDYIAQCFSCDQYSMNIVKYIDSSILYNPAKHVISIMLDKLPKTMYGRERAIELIGDIIMLPMFEYTPALLLSWFNDPSIYDLNEDVVQKLTDCVVQYPSMGVFEDSSEFVRTIFMESLQYFNDHQMIALFDKMNPSMFDYVNPENGHTIMMRLMAHNFNIDVINKCFEKTTPQKLFAVSDSGSTNLIVAAVYKYDSIVHKLIDLAMSNVVSINLNEYVNIQTEPDNVQTSMSALHFALEHCEPETAVRIGLLTTIKDEKIESIEELWHEFVKHCQKENDDVVDMLLTRQFSNKLLHYGIYELRYFEEYPSRVTPFIAHKLIDRVWDNDEPEAYQSIIDVYFATADFLDDCIHHAIRREDTTFLENIVKHPNICLFLNTVKDDMTVFTLLNTPRYAHLKQYRTAFVKVVYDTMNMVTHSKMLLAEIMPEINRLEAEARVKIVQQTSSRRSYAGAVKMRRQK